MPPGASAETAACAFGPTQSSAKATGRSMISAVARAIGRSDSAGSRPFGRPKWASRTTLPPRSAISSIVGATRSIRVASPTRPFSIGTLRSTRTRTRLLATSAWSRVRNVFIEEQSSDQLPHRDGRVGHAVGEAPFVVVPRHDTHQRSIDDLGLVHVEDRAVRVVIEVHRDV